MKDTWRTINQLLGKSTTSARVNELSINDTKITDPVKIADEFNRHFSEVGANLSRTLEVGDERPEDYLVPTDQEFKFSYISEQHVFRLLSKLSIHKSAGPDKISGRLLKLASPCISFSLARIFNSSISKGIFPNDWKCARVTPIFKSDLHSDPSNYRPISILPIVARLFERIIFDQFYDYLMMNNLLAPEQSGFRPMHSTVSALLKATDLWLTNMDEGLLNGILFVDLKKAFDTVNHDILIRKLSLFGVKGSVLSWFLSYLSDRRQHCCVNGVASSEKFITHEVPQGSVLGPLLFIIYINDFPKCLSEAIPNMYADDTNITITASNSREIETNLNGELVRINRWLRANRLHINTAKTEYMVVASAPRLSALETDPVIALSNSIIKRVTSKNSLGVIIDDKLNWNDQIDKVIKKVSCALKVIRRMKQFVPTSTLLDIYNSIVLPHFDYCSSVWGNCGKVLRDKLQKLQNRAARVITFAHLDTPSSEALDSLNWESLEQRRLRLDSNFMYKVTHGLTPNYLFELFKKTSERHNYALRGAEHNLVLPKPMRDFRKRSFSYRGAVTWNSLATQLREAPSLSSFRNIMLNRE